MHHLIAEFAHWIQNTSIALAVGGSSWAYTFVQFTHFTGLSLWLGTNFALDLHLMGFGRRTQTSAQFLKALIVWNWIGFCILVTGGALLFSTAASAFVANPAFDVKIGMLLPVALIWHILVQIKTPSWGRAPEVPKIAKFAGGFELLMWMGVATAATAIPYFELLFV